MSKISKDELLKSINLNRREIEAFGGTVTIRDLTIKEMLSLPEDKNEQLFAIVSKGLVEPKLSEAELGKLGMTYLDDLANIVTAVTDVDD